MVFDLLERQFVPREPSHLRGDPNVVAVVLDALGIEVPEIAGEPPFLVAENNNHEGIRILVELLLRPFFE